MHHSSPLLYSALETQKLTGGYGAAPILQDIDLRLNHGEWLSLVGANGSGKSTLMRLLSRILKPHRGAIFLDGRAIHTQSVQMIARQIAFLPQQPIVPEGLTVQQLVSLGRTPHQPWWRWEMTPKDRQQVDWAITQTQLVGFQDRPVEQLSGGERQRAFLAMALAQEPRILLLDEPTTFLDIHYQLELLELLRLLNHEQNLTIVTVLHDLNLAMRYSDRIAVLHQGRLLALGTPMEVITTDNLRRGFGVEAMLIQTPLGLQICPVLPGQLRYSRDGPNLAVDTL